MDMFEKVDKLRERANVSYEEAKNALDRANGDILDAMILLEREGKTRQQGSESYNTAYTAEQQNAQAQYSAGYDQNAQRNAGPADGRTFGDKVKALFHKSTVNYVAIDRKGERIMRIPILAAILIVLFAWYAAIIAVIVSLFLDCKYSFEGQDEMKAANDVAGKAGNLAEQVKEKVVNEYNKL
jgi:hypothetical protein